MQSMQSAVASVHCDAGRTIDRTLVTNQIGITTSVSRVDCPCRISRQSMLTRFASTSSYSSLANSSMTA